MSVPTVLFVLERVLAQGATGRLVMAALGPGFTLSLLPLEAWVAAALLIAFLALQRLGELVLARRHGWPASRSSAGASRSTRCSR